MTVTDIYVCVLYHFEHRLQCWLSLITKQWLEASRIEDYGILKAESGEEAVELLKEHTVHCGLLDIHLGEGMSGIKVMEHIRNLKNMRKIPLVAVTAFYAGDMSKQLLDSGFDDYLAKPYKFNELEKILKKNGII